MSLILESPAAESTASEPFAAAESTAVAVSVRISHSVPNTHENEIADSDEVASWRCGRILVRDGKLVSIRRRHWTIGASLAQVVWQAGWGRSDDDTCVIDYHSPRGMPAFITFDYMRAGRTAGYRSFCKAIRTLEEVASMKNTHAIVAHITNPAITDRLLTRWGWEQHCLHWKGRHWIKRFS